MLKKLYRKISRFSVLHKKAMPYWSEWDQRIADVISSDDNHYIPRVTNAGKIFDTYQIMHNGLKIIKGSYYGEGITKMLLDNKGVHEPQEEKVFQQVLKTLPQNPVMIELGSYWAFYSMWFLQQYPMGRSYLFEPDIQNLEFGIKNFELNHFNGDFTHAFIGKQFHNNIPPILTIDQIVEEKEISFIDILHCDIQGYELEMLMGAQHTIKEQKVGYFFISTHSNKLHRDCLNFLEKQGLIIVCECDLKQTYSVDGLIVAKNQSYKGIENIEISKKSAFS
ncbi:FkbM family methyltransferase [Pedobacter montanisoli]|uniref:FkbM family methyltransferase n=1 Tax=Pedobacter montanisoli TaxID=2923277 RepID=A0ABS9ZVW5_9SPHI|nr:FkbM family methyltransferase [Pedobacter montanisoli]MCJ0742449.1 FkbM family methyltransferase [Pedobacter montanisoli]